MIFPFLFNFYLIRLLDSKDWRKFELFIRIIKCRIYSLQFCFTKIECLNYYLPTLNAFCD